MVSIVKRCSRPRSRVPEVPFEFFPDRHWEPGRQRQLGPPQAAISPLLVTVQVTETTSRWTAAGTKHETTELRAGQPSPRAAKRRLQGLELTPPSPKPRPALPPPLSRPGRGRQYPLVTQAKEQNVHRFRAAQRQRFRWVRLRSPGGSRDGGANPADGETR